MYDLHIDLSDNSYKFDSLLTTMGQLPARIDV